MSGGVLSDKSLTMTYFHRRPSTIIGAKAFHGPVRDGKAWDHLAMVVKRNWFALSCVRGCRATPAPIGVKKHAPGSVTASGRSLVCVYVWVVLGLRCCVFRGTYFTLQPARL